MSEINIEVRYRGPVVYTGPWQGAPSDVANYIQSASEIYKTDEELRDYLTNRPEPIVLLYKGYTYRVV